MARLDDNTQPESFDPAGFAPRGTNHSGMRVFNEKLVLTLLRRHGALAKSDITRMTGLSAQTISVIMRRLEADGLLLRGDPVRGKIGQPSIPMSLDPEGAFFFGLKIGRRSAELVLTNFLGQVIDRVARTHRLPDPESSISFAHEAIETMLARLTPAQSRRIAGLGIAMPFYLWNWAAALGVPEEKMAGWRHADIRAEIAARYDFPVYQENDASSACSAEVAFGPADNPADYLYFYVGYFIGGGVVLNGALFTGPGGNSGALGPMPVLARDGKVRQLIDVASLSAVERKLAETGQPANSMWESADNWTIDKAIMDGWIDTAGEGLARAVVAACSVIDFSAVIIDGWMPQTIRQQLVASVTHHLTRQTMTGLEVPVVREGSAGPDARALGAASLPMFDRYLLDQYPVKSGSP